MTKIKIASVVTLVGMMASGGLSFVGAQTASLSASCSGSVAVNAITWTATATGGTAPYSYAWSGAVSGTSSVATATYTATGTYSVSAAVGDTTTSTASTTCSATVSVLPTPPPPPPAPAPTSTVIHRVPFFKEPMLQVNPGGHFLARGMVVQSVSSGSFIGKVWGTSWTVIIPSSTELLLRDGKGVKVSSVEHLQVGDEVGVSGRVDPNHELTVIADVVRNYSILVVRPKPAKEMKEFKNEMRDDDDDGDERREEKKEKSNNGKNNQDIRSQIEQLMAEIRKIQEQLKNR